MTTSPVRYTLIFDGACGMCMRWMGRVRSWDTKEVFEYLPLQDPSIPERFPSLTREALEQAMHVVGPDGRVWAGSAAVEKIVDLLPMGRWVSWIFALPFARPIADRVYRWVADNRSRLGCGEHCGVGEPA